MTEGQKYLFKLFKEVDEICRKNKIRYYLAGGTLIGAVRHRGFVPWDDDFDLYMTRDEFLKFVKVAKAGGLPENRSLECQEISRDYRNVFARYTDLSTTAIHKNQLISDDVAGEVLDILQLDPVPNNPKIQKRHFKLLLLYGDLINPSAAYSSRCDWNKYSYSFLKKVMNRIGREKVLGFVEKRLFRYQEKDCDTYIMRWSGAPLIFKKELFEPAIETEFEGVPATIPRGFNQYLIDHYGDDWMYIPQVSHQLSHEAVHSLKHDYSLIRETYINVVDKQSTMINYEKRKLSILFSVGKSHKVADKIVTLRGERVKEELLKEIKDKKIDVENWYIKKEYKNLERLFSDYYKLQGNAQFSGRDNFKSFYRYQKPILIDLPINILKVALLVQNDIGKTGKAYRTLQIYEQIKGNLPDELKAVKRKIALQRDAMNAYSFGDYDRALAVLRPLVKENPDNIIPLKLLIRCLLETNTDLNSVQKLINHGKKIYPNDGEFLKYAGDLIFEKKPKDACDLYMTARTATSNGCVLLEIEDKIKNYIERLKKQMVISFENLNYIKAKKLYEQIMIYGENAEADYLFFKGMLVPEISCEKAYEMYLLAKDKILIMDEQKYREIMMKILSYSGESPVVAHWHIEFLYAAQSRIENYQLKKSIEETAKDLKTKGLETYYLELRKLYGDMLKQEGRISDAYEIYRDVYKYLNHSCVTKWDLERIFKRDIEKIIEMKKENIQVENLKKNLGVKFNSLEVFKQLFSKIDSNLCEYFVKNFWEST